MHALLRADQIQPLDDAARHAAEAAERGVASSINAALRALVESLDAQGLASMIRRNDFTTLWRHLAIERLRAALQPALNRLAVVHDQSAGKASLGIASSPVSKARPRYVRTPDVINLTYDPIDPATVQAQNRVARAITDNLEGTTRATAETVLSEGLRRGLSPETIARNLADTLGLTQAEANAIQSYRMALEADSLSPLSRALRDRRFDARVRRGDLSESDIDRAASRYAARYRAYRAERIARTESLRAANAGRLAAWTQYADRSGRQPDEIRKFWIIAGDELVCPICRVIPGMNEGGIPLDGRYDSPLGLIDGPPDPHPLCRCTERFERVSRSEADDGRSTSGVGFRIELDYGEN